MSRESQSLDRVRVTFDDDNLVANADLLLPATLVERLDWEALIDATVRLDGRVGGAPPGGKVLTLMNTMLAGGSHIDHAAMLRAGATESVVSHRVMAPSTLGTFLRSLAQSARAPSPPENALAVRRASEPTQRHQPEPPPACFVTPHRASGSTHTAFDLPSHTRPRITKAGSVDRGSGPPKSRTIDAHVDVIGVLPPHVSGTPDRRASTGR